MKLKDILFPDPDITGHADSGGVAIMAGCTVIDETGAIWYILRDNGQFVAALEPTLDNPNTTRMPLNMFMTLSNELEVQ